MSMFRRACAPIETVLPRFETTAAEASRLLHDQRFIQAWRDQDDALNLEPAATPPGEPLQRLRVGCTAGVVEVLLTARDRPALVMAAARPVRTTARAQVLQLLAAEALFAPALQALQRLGLGETQAQSLTPFNDATDTVPAGGWCVVRNAGGELGTFVVSEWPAAATAILQSHISGIPSSRALRGRLALRGAVTLAERPVRRTLLRSLQPGDVVLMLAGAADAQAATCRVRWGLPGGRCWSAPAHIDDLSLTIQGEPCMSLEERDQPHGPDALGDLDIPVRFEVETVAVPLRDLEAISPGYVVELTTPLASAQLRLVACGQVVGQAELVVVGDRLGARITRMVTGDGVQSRG
jgi:type III secretion protein Q